MTSPSEDIGFVSKFVLPHFAHALRRSQYVAPHSLHTLATRCGSPSNDRYSTIEICLAITPPSLPPRPPPPPRLAGPPPTACRARRRCREGDRARARR